MYVLTMAGVKEQLEMTEGMRLEAVKELEASQHARALAAAKLAAAEEQILALQGLVDGESKGKVLLHTNLTVTHRHLSEIKLQVRHMGADVWLARICRRSLLLHA
jgi:hypothetical protein